jgi:hypothetical protein
MPEAQSSYEMVFEAVKAAAASVRSGRYYVRRGVIDYATFPWDQKPYTIAILEADVPLEERAGPDTATFVMELMTDIPEGTDLTNDDKVIYDIRTDARDILRAVRQAAINSNRRVIDRISKSRFSIAYDQIMRVQGGTVTFDVDYTAKQLLGSLGTQTPV